ncbi:MAG: hypothetical protein ACYSOT_02830 [Planctomycetota bacterium]
MWKARLLRARYTFRRAEKQQAAVTALVATMRLDDWQDYLHRRPRMARNFGHHPEPRVPIGLNRSGPIPPK